MPFHAYTNPSDYVYMIPHARQFIYSDAQLVGGNVRFYMSYYGGPIMDQFSRPDSMWMKITWNNQYAFGTAFSDQFSVNSSGAMQQGDVGNDQNWQVASQQLYATSADTWSPDFHFTDADGTATVIAPTGGGAVGLAFRGNGINGSNTDFLCIDNAVNKMRLKVRGTTVWTGTTTITPGSSHTIRGVVSGNAYTIYLDGNVEGSYTLAVGAERANASQTCMGVQSSGDTTGKITFLRFAPHADPVPTTVTVRNYDGTVVYTASLPLNTDHSILDIPDSALSQRGARGPYGWYRLYLTGTDHGDGQWGTAYGDTSFCRVPNSVLTDNSSYKRWDGFYPENNDQYARMVLGVGPERFSPGNPYNRNTSDGVTVAGSPTVTSATTNFTSADLGHTISDGGLIGQSSLPPHTHIPPNTYIGVINSSTSIGLSSSPTSNVPVNATASGTGVIVSIGSSVVADNVTQPWGEFYYEQKQMLPNVANSSGRPREALGTFTGYTEGHEQTLTAIVNELKSFIKVWEVTNEPDAASVTDLPGWVQYVWGPAKAAILAADPTAKVVGPCPTTITPNNQFFQKFVTALNGSGVHADGWSFHPYNSYQGELAAIRRNLGAILATVQGH